MNTRKTHILYPAPLSPTGYNITRIEHDAMETTVTIDWDSPQGSGVEAVVDYYTVSISPTPPYQPGMFNVSSPPWNVTLTHNLEYTGNITAINCVGESTPLPIPPIKFGKQGQCQLYFKIFVFSFAQ